jgi:hypothetical protein
MTSRASRPRRFSPSPWPGRYGHIPAPLRQRRRQDGHPGRHRHSPAPLRPLRRRVTPQCRTGHRNIGTPSPGAEATPQCRYGHETDNTAISWRRSSHEADGTTTPQRRTGGRPSRTRTGHAPAIRKQTRTKECEERHCAHERTNKLIRRRRARKRTDPADGPRCGHGVPVTKREEEGV